MPPLLLPLADGIVRREEHDETAIARPAAEAAPAAVVTVAPTSPPLATPLASAAVAAIEESEFAPPVETVRLARPTEEAVQLLPARLEIIAGMPRRQDIRFFRTPGETPHMILGREPGASPHHVTLTSSTVSRRHAQVAFTNGQWKVVNLSTTNPVVVNDHALPGPRSEQTLVDGDRIELGDVVLRFHAS